MVRPPWPARARRLPRKKVPAFKLKEKGGWTEIIKDCGMMQPAADAFKGVHSMKTELFVARAHEKGGTANMDW